MSVYQLMIMHEHVRFDSVTFLVFHLRNSDMLGHDSPPNASIRIQDLSEEKMNITKILNIIISFYTTGPVGKIIISFYTTGPVGEYIFNC